MRQPSSFCSLNRPFFFSRGVLVISLSLSAMRRNLMLLEHDSTFLRPRVVLDSSVNLAWLLFYFSFFHFMRVSPDIFIDSVNSFSMLSSPCVLHFFLPFYFPSITNFCSALLPYFADYSFLGVSFTRESKRRCNFPAFLSEPFYLETFALLDIPPSSSPLILMISPRISLRIFYIHGCSHILAIEGLSCGSNCRISMISDFSSLQKLLPS